MLSWNSSTLATWCEELTHWTRPWYWEGLGAGEGDNRDVMAGWHHRLDGHEFEWTPGVGDKQGGLACCNSWGRKESDTAERLNWTELNTYIWNLERWYWWKYFQSSNADTDIENRLMEMGRREEGEGGIYWQSNMETYITMCKIDS